MTGAARLIAPREATVCLADRIAIAIHGIYLIFPLWLVELMTYSEQPNGKTQRRQTTSNLVPVAFDRPLPHSIRWQQLLLSIVEGIVEGEILPVLPTLPEGCTLQSR